MKKLRNTSWYAAALIAASMTSCNKQLDEYNPGGSNADGVWATPGGFVTAVNAAYYAQRYWYGKEDGVFMSETGTDLWMNQSLQNYAVQVSRYNGLNGTVGYINNTWRQLWAGINQCNAGIDRIDQVPFTDLVEKSRRLGELKFLRAFYYWHIVETWGNVMLREHETTEFENTATRAEIKDFYNLMISDLEYAKDNLPNDWGNEYSRATKKSALGMLARVYLTRAYYPDADATAMFTKARDVAKEVIARKAEFNVELWANPADIWNAAYNKTSKIGTATIKGNKESLYTISNSTVSTTFNFDANANREHMYFLANYSTTRPGMIQTNAYGRDGGRYFMPTRYLLDLFEPGDTRYDASFQETWNNNSDAQFVWTTATFATYGAYNNKDASVVTNGLTIEKNALALKITRGTQADKKTVNYVAIDRDDIYNSNGSVKTSNGSYPALKKFQDPTRPVLVTQQQGYNDIFVIRLAEMYLIAGEAEYKLGNAGPAADLFNVLRTRASAPAIGSGLITPTWILEERARELCGEHIRWFDLKRILRGDEWANFIKLKNPDITLVKAPYWVRPISQTELNGLLNATEFGQNTGY
jgi:hypothetical protein